MKPGIWGVALLIVAAGASAQQCGYVNNVYKCVAPNNCGYVNGVYSCAGATPAGCGTVNGVYTCTSTTGVATGSDGNPDSGSTQTGSQVQSMVQAAAGSIGAVISGLANWLLGVLEFIPEWVWSQVLGAIVGVVGQIPVPAAITQFTTNIGNLPSGVVWFLTLIDFKAQLGFIMGALVIRFLMTWIPFAGPKA